jgi:MscS family membrane protein
VLFLGVLAAQSAWTQAIPPGPSSAPAKPEVPQDALGRTTPRGTVRGFLSAAGKGEIDTAARYLSTRLRGEPATALAHKLFVVLNSRLPGRLNEISDRAEGSLPYPGEPGKDVIGTISSDIGNVDVLVERVEQKDAGPIWLFSRKTLDEVPELYAEVSSEAGGNRFTKFLLETRIAHIALIHWLALFVGLPLLFLLGARLNRVLSPPLGRLLLRLNKNPALRDPEFLSIPVRLLLLAAAIYWMLSAIALPILARQFWSSIAAITVIVGIVWLIIRLNGWFETKIRVRLGRRHRTGALSMLRFARSAVDGLIIFVGLLVVFHYFGINATTALAGLGVGGIAVALAAQKTLENVIAGVSLISDKAIRVGDFLRVSGTLGTVTDIGLRSTRIRTLDRTVVNVPNGQIANASLENLSLRDQFWFHHTVRLTYETTVTQLRSILAGLTNLLLRSSAVEESSARVRFLGFGESSLDSEIFAYVYARDWPDFLRLQEELLLQVMDLVEAAGARIALPSRITYLTGSVSTEIGTDVAAQTTDEGSEVRTKPRKLAPKPLATRKAGASEYGG